MKKSGKGRDSWFSSCDLRGKARRKMPTPVRTRFAPSIFMMSMMLVYREVAEHFFSKQDSIELRNRFPSNNTWEVIGTIVTVKQPLMGAVYLSQRRDWLLSDAVALVAKLYARYSDMARGTVIFSERASEFTRGILLYNTKLAQLLSEALEEVVPPVLSFRGLDGKYAHRYLSVVLYPQYNSNMGMKAVMMPLHCNNMFAIRDLAKKYDDSVILPLLANVYRHRRVGQKEAGKDSDTDTNTDGKRRLYILRKMAKKIFFWMRGSRMMRGFATLSRWN